MRELYNTVYTQPELLWQDSATSSASNIQSANWLIFDEDFDDDDAE